MSLTIVARLEQLDHFIRIRATGTAQELAEKMHVSRRTVFIYLDILRAQGASIAYSKTRRSYYYETEGNFRFSFRQKKGMHDDV